MKITETEMRGLITGKAMPADIFVGESLAAYLVRKFTNLHTERDALAAENAAMKSIVEPIANLSQYSDVVAEMSEALRHHEADGFVSLFSMARHMETSPTAAYLNSVRAEGVEMFAELHDATAEKYRSESPGCYGEQLHQHASSEAVKFAAQLRAGKDGE